MLHAIVCEVNYATRSGEIVVKKLLCDTNTPKGKTCALKSADKDPKLLEITQSVIPLVSQWHTIEVPNRIYNIYRMKSYISYLISNYILT